ncbi:hypothetical protein COV86_04965 [Candidatus Roizmanbacteria bacterium CG11_big_fil_rev_8_21_14_0_20_35_14]|uniref:Glycosyltransferase RgtA/B/C/D-like domain-containing protein n=2 Tax=Candidatus Roizmaniibacteriota TaxID=1752723 RepID=A0A2M8EY93_9BACT|nr:MAG: hypothetical protein COV86_04965 [Candidatus Roizmanbacteria bacterium CG11_big_fil_rev_8_21_14_0_20_35_14]PJC31363.1 MAG: hypothetical protein CO049_04305 [Candidatus Roizmanbacteria bacterium CG_4_9_14_0_2_um_filter_36_12]
MVKKVWIIIFLGLLIYGFSLFNGFVWDDEVVFQNSISPFDSTYYRPVTSVIRSTIYNIFGPRPFFFHFFQLIFHIVTAVFIYYLFKRFFKETLSLILALIFLVHPANVEAVSFASAMQEVLFTLTGLTGLYLFISSKNLSIAKIFLSTVILLIALLMKETAIVFFVLVFCYLFLFKKNKQNVLINYSILIVILLMTYLLVRISGGNLYIHGQGLFPIMRVSFITRLMNIPLIIKYYLGMFFFPINLAIAQHWVIKLPSFINFFLPLILEVLLFLTAVIYSLKKKDKIFAFFFLWFLVGLLPHLQIIPLNMTVAERWLYFPMIGLLGMMGSIIKISNIKYQISKILFSLAIIIISIFSIRSFIRTLDWRNGLALFGHDIKKTSSFDLQNNFGTELFRVGRYDEAKKYFKISTELAPYWWVNWNNLGAIYEREKNYQKAAEYYQKSINNGQYYLAYENLAKILVLHGKDQKKTEEFLKEVLKLFPKNENLLRINALLIEK